jgi:adenylate cyclase
MATASAPALAGAAAGASSDLIDRVQRRIVPRVVGANLAGVAVVFAASTLAAPAQSLTAWRTAVIGVVMGLYTVVAVITGVRAGVRGSRAALQPLLEGRAATIPELRRMVTTSALQTRSLAVRWLIAAALVGATLAATRDVAGDIARSTVITLLGGLTSCALSFLLTEPVTRPLQAAARRGVLLDGCGSLGIRTRLIVTWTVGSGIPLVGIALALADGELDRGRLVALGILLAVTGMVVGSTLLAMTAAAIADPLDDIRNAMGRVRDGRFDVDVTVSDAGEVGQLQAGFNRMVQGLREREQLRDVFGRHVGIEVARQAMQRTDLGGEARTVSVLFVDVIGSTTLAEQRPPGEIVALLNAVFDAVVRITTDNGGMVNKFEGDAALCVFGAPVEQPDHAARALRAARELRAALRDLAAQRPDLDAAIGVSCGRVVAGNLGARERYEYTVIGSAVNEAARLTEAAKREPARLLASAAVIAAAEDEAAQWRQGDALHLRGYSEPTQSYVPAAG